MQNITVTLPTNSQQIQQAAQGWTQYKSNFVPRLIISSQATQGSGKTHLGLTMPGPIAFINNDDGLEAVAEKFVQRGKVIVVKDFRLNPLRPMTLEMWDQYFYAMRDSYLWAVSCGQFRSVVVDTCDQMWQAQRMEAFGKLSQIPPLKYGEVNGQFEAMLNYAKGYSTNVLLTHRMKAEYVNDAGGRGQKTGALVPTGYSGIGYVAQVQIQQIWHPELKCPALKIVEKCRANPWVQGRELYDKQCNFQGLAQLIYPESDPKAWTDGVEL